MCTYMKLEILLRIYKIKTTPFNTVIVSKLRSHLQRGEGLMANNHRVDQLTPQKDSTFKLLKISTARKILSAALQSYILVTRKSRKEETLSTINWLFLKI